jgi:hypothetical protein
VALRDGFETHAALAMRRKEEHDGGGIDLPPSA